MFATVDWSQLADTEIALITFNATIPNQPSMSFTAMLNANYTEAPSNFTGDLQAFVCSLAHAHILFPGFIEGDGTVSMEAAHASRNTSVDGITWTTLPGYGRTLSAVTPWPRGGDELNFTVGTGPSMYVHRCREFGGTVFVRF